MSLLQQIHSGRRHAPPRILIYGTDGIGKSTTGAQAPRPVFIQTEDGLDQIECDSFPRAARYADVVAALSELRRIAARQERRIVELEGLLNRVEKAVSRRKAG